MVGLSGDVARRIHQPVYVSVPEINTIQFLLSPIQTLGGFIKDEYCSWVQYKSGPGGGPSM